MEATAQSKHWMQGQRTDLSEWNSGKQEGNRQGANPKIMVREMKWIHNGLESKPKEGAFWAEPWLQADLGSWVKQRILVQSYYISRSGTLFVVKKDYFKEIPGSCNQFLILMETACYVVHTG